MIRNLHLLIDTEATQIQATRKDSMSQHIVEAGRFKYVFGWDQALMSFFLQVHDSEIIDPDNNPVHWVGADPQTKMYEVEELCRAADIHGLYISHDIRVQLYAEKDDGV